MSTKQLKYSLALYMCCYLRYNNAGVRTLYIRSETGGWLIEHYIDKPYVDDWRSWIFHPDFKCILS